VAPFASFIIPSLGRHSLVETQYSLMEQSDPDWEALVVCDPSWQKRPGISNKDKRISYVRGTHEGSAGLLRNTGIEMANGEWVCFVDDDDTVSPQYVEHLREHAEDYPTVDVVVFRMDHPRFGILPRVDIPVIAHGQVGISFAIKREIRPFFKTGDALAPIPDDIELLSRLKQQGKEFYISPHVDYKVGE
jgi:glycosyltransferase involved in cell wall biosynthesis